MAELAKWDGMTFHSALDLFRFFAEHGWVLTEPRIEKDPAVGASYVVSAEDVLDWIELWGRLETVTVWDDRDCCDGYPFFTAKLKDAAGIVTPWCREESGGDPQLHNLYVMSRYEVVKPGVDRTSHRGQAESDKFLAHLCADFHPDLFIWID